MIKLPEAPTLDVDPIIKIMNGLEKGLLLISAMEYGIFSHLSGDGKKAKNLSMDT